MADYDAWVAGRLTSTTDRGEPLEAEIPEQSFYLQEVSRRRVTVCMELRAG